MKKIIYILAIGCLVTNYAYAKSGRYCGQPDHIQCGTTPTPPTPLPPLTSMFDKKTSSGPAQVLSPSPTKNPLLSPAPITQTIMNNQNKDQNSDQNTNDPFKKFLK